MNQEFGNHSRTTLPACFDLHPEGFPPCNGCTACCHGDAVRLLDGDDPAAYQTEPHPLKKDALMLAHKANGECVYLGPGGCTIHERRPLMCRCMDCRLIAQRFTYTQARKMAARGIIRLAVWKAGKERSR